MSSGISVVRRQLSLYVSGEFAPAIEAVRKVVDPVQISLIPAHVTLCREDEILDLSFPELQHRLSDERCKPITLSFGPVQAFAGHGLLLPCTTGTEEFKRLREHILGSREIREQPPHITLAHPRNPKAPGNSRESVSGLPANLTITFDSVSLIEQTERQPWRLLGSVTLKGNRDGKS